MATETAGTVPRPTFFGWMRRIREREEESSQTNQFVLRALEEDKREGQRIATIARTVALAVIALLLPFLNPTIGVLYYEAFMVGFVAIGHRTGSDILGSCAAHLRLRRAEPVRGRRHTDRLRLSFQYLYLFLRYSCRGHARIFLAHDLFDRNLGGRDVAGCAPRRAPVRRAEPRASRCGRQGVFGSS